ncbi:TonB family protein, partial [Sphingomonas sp. GC_Shp_4]
PIMDSTPTIAAPALALSSQIEAPPAPAIGPAQGLAARDGQGSGRGVGDGMGDGDGTGGRGPTYGAAAWIVKPNDQEMAPFWPLSAKANRKSGLVMLECKVPRPGPPKRCRIASEVPRHYGFGAAALAMSRLFRIRPVTRDTATLDLPVIVPVVFDARKLAVSE